MAAPRIRYQHVHPTIWGPKLRALRAEAPDAFALFLYIKTSRLRASEGLFFAPVEMMAVETGMTAQDVREALTELERRGETMYDAEAEVLFDRSALDHYTPRGHNQITGAVNAIANLPRCPRLQRELWKSARVNAPEFAERLQEFFPAISSPPSFEGDSKGIRRGFEAQEKEKEIEKEIEKELPPRDQLVERLIEASTARDRGQVAAEAVAVILHLREHLDATVIDECIGRSLAREDKLRWPRGVVKAVQTIARSRGIHVPDFDASGRSA